MATVRDFFACSGWVDRLVLKPLSHIRANWELSWDDDSRAYVPEDDSFADLLNQLIQELDKCDTSERYHNDEDILGVWVQERLNWNIKKDGHIWVRDDGKRLEPDGYIVLLQQGAFQDVNESHLVKAAAGRIQAAIMQGQTHFDQMELSHQYILAGVLTSILYHRADL